MNVAIVIVLSIVGQIVMTVTFAKEALTTKEGAYCKVKCGIAGATYLFFAILMAWFLLVESVKL